MEKCKKCGRTKLTERSECECEKTSLTDNIGSSWPLIDTNLLDLGSSSDSSSGVDFGGGDSGGGGSGGDW